MVRLSSSQISLIISSSDSLTVLARRYGVSLNAIRYHRDSSFRDKLRVYNRNRYALMSGDDKKEYFSKKKDYQRIYHKNRYDNDPEFRNKQLLRSRIYQKNNYKSKKRH